MKLPLVRCLLFVPATRPDRFPKAAASGADAVCIDLEDSVASTEKQPARENAVRHFSSPSIDGLAAWAVRLNSLSTPEGREDLQALVAANCRPDLVILTKVKDAGEIRIVHESWANSRPPLICTIETPSGVLNAREIAAQADGGLFFGAADLSMELGVTMDSESVAHARGMVVLAGHAAGRPLLDTPFLKVGDPDGLSADARRSKAWGFTGKAAIHPQQVAAILAAFTPDSREIAEAERALAAFTAAGEKVTLFEGRLLERPIIEAYRRTLQRAAEAGRTRS